MMDLLVINLFKVLRILLFGGTNSSVTLEKVSRNMVSILEGVLK